MIMQKKTFNPEAMLRKTCHKLVVVPAVKCDTDTVNVNKENNSVALALAVIDINGAAGC